jgi:hypothetical protein
MKMPPKKQTLYRTAEMKNHVHTDGGTADIPAGACVAVRYAGAARHPWLRVSMDRYAVTHAGIERGIFWERDLCRFVL